MAGRTDPTLYPLIFDIGVRAAHVLIVENIWAQHANPETVGRFLWDPADPWLEAWARGAEAERHATFG